MMRQPWEYEVTPQIVTLLDRGLELLSAWMPELIRSPNATQEPADAKDSLHHGKRPAHDAARERRVARVLRAHVEWGWSTEQIAAHESLSRRRVQQLLAEHAGVDAAVASGPAA